MQAEGVYEVLAAYGVDSSILEEYHCVPVRATVVRDFVKIRTEAGARALKRVNMTEQRLNYVFECAEYLSRLDLAFVPRFIRTRYGDPYVSHDSGLYYMTAWWSGREADFRKQPELLAGARLLAEWQHAASGFHPVAGWHPDSSTLSSRVRTMAAEVRRQVGVARENTQPTAFDRVFLACADELTERLDKCQARLQEVRVDQLELSAREQGLLCHGSYTRQNVWYNGDKYAALSYDRMHRGLPATELALFMHRYLPGFDWDVQVAADVVSAYRQAWSEAIASDQVLEALLSVPLRSIQVVAWYYQNAKDWDEEEYVDALEASLQLDEQRSRAVAELYEAGTRIPVLDGFPKPDQEVGVTEHASSDWRHIVVPQLTKSDATGVEDSDVTDSGAGQSETETAEVGNTSVMSEPEAKPSVHAQVERAPEEGEPAQKRRRTQSGRVTDATKRRNRRSATQAGTKKRAKERSPQSHVSGPKLLGRTHEDSDE